MGGAGDYGSVAWAALGLITAASFFAGGATLWWLGYLNQNAGYWDIFWPQFIQGAGMALLFVPLTTVAMATISRSPRS